MKLFKKEGSCMKKTNPKTEKVALRWLQYSNKDLENASHMINTKPDSFALVCWLYQQSAEKAIKSALTLEQIRVMHIHDLDILLDMLPGNWIVKKEHTDLSKITGWAVSARYPGDWPEPTYEDAMRAKSTAHSIYGLISAEFKRRGILLGDTRGE